MSKRCNEMRICETCKNEYIAKVVNARFCSLKCMYKWRSTLPITERQHLAGKSRSEKLKETRVCTWCQTEFRVKPSIPKAMCSRKCMYEWRKAQNWETIKCIGCDSEFKRYKNQIHSKTGLPTQFCSNNCSITSPQKREKLRMWGLSDKNHLYRSDVQAKISKANGKNTSKPQRAVYEQIKKQHPDAILECWLRDAKKSADIFIPKEKKIIEIYGTYWHCDPRKYKSDFFHSHEKQIAQDIWKRDAARKKFLEELGYTVEIIWESDITP